MKKMKQLLVLAGLILGSLAGGSQALANYDDGATDPTNGNEGLVEKTDNAQISVDGWVGEFDPTNPGPGPNPDPGASGWVNVTLPTAVVFGAVDVDNGKVKSPSYKITNNSVKGVKISVEDFTKGKDADKLPDLDLKLAANNKEIQLINASSAASKEEIITLNEAGGTVTSVDFKFAGTVGATHDYKTTIEPQYNLVLKFEAQK